MFEQTDQTIRRHVLSDGDVLVTILNLGCITQDWQVPLNGRRVPVVLGYDDPQAYRNNPFFMGAIVGRVANRVSGAGFSLGADRFVLDMNEPPHHLHGGAGGLQTRIWAMEPDGPGVVRLRYVSADGEQGYPGRVVFTVVIALRGHTLCYDMMATSDRPTPVNLAQHSYYNLMGAGSVMDHRLQISADAITPVDGAMIPTGDSETLDGLPVDLRQPRDIRQADPDQTGIDMNFVLDGSRAISMTAPNGMALTLKTDQPCLQVFTAPALRPIAPTLEGQGHGPFGGVCLEPQHYPDAVNTPQFPSHLVTPDHPYHQRLEVCIAPGVGA